MLTDDSYRIMSKGGNMLKKSKIMILLLLALFIQVFSLPDYKPVVAEETVQIVSELTITNPQDQYFSNQALILKGKWQLPNDGTQTFQKGDSFSISIPEGLSLAPGDIDLGGFGTGTQVGNKIVFTFSAKINGLVDRKGGFNLLLNIDPPQEEEIIDLPLNFEDEKGRPILKTQIKVDGRKNEVVGEDKERFAKNDYGITSPGKKGPQWYIRVNKSGEINEDSVQLKDELGADHIIDQSTFAIQKSAQGDINTGTDYPIDQVHFNEDGRGFSVDLDLRENQWYTITYESIFIGNPQSESVKDGIAHLENNAYLTGVKNGALPLDNNQNNNKVVGQYSISGWGEGTSTEGQFIIYKVDKLTRQPISGIEFTIKHVVSGLEYTGLTDENGLVRFENIKDGVYELVESPTEIYDSIENQFIEVAFDQEGVFKVTIENEQKPFTLTVEKNWQNAQGQAIEAEYNVVFELYANDTLIRRIVLDKSMREFSFHSLAYNNHLGKINYELKEILPMGYHHEMECVDHHCVVTNIKNKPIIPPSDDVEAPPQVDVEKPPQETPINKPVIKDETKKPLTVLPAAGVSSLMEFSLILLAVGIAIKIYTNESQD